jgi:hypothetical protein
MPRYRFTAKDLVQFLPLLKTPAASVLTLARPIKNPSLRRPRHVEDLGPLPVEVAGKAAPEGVPLQDLLAVVRERSPQVEGLVVRGGRLQASSKKAPTDEQREAVKGLLGDKKRLTEALAQRPRKPTEPASGDRLHEVLHDAKIADQEWLRAFRQYATTQLVPKKKGG